VAWVLVLVLAWGIRAWLSSIDTRLSNIETTVHVDGRTTAGLSATVAQLESRIRALEIGGSGAP
jgi:hypothetical protein